MRSGILVVIFLIASITLSKAQDQEKMDFIDYQISKFTDDLGNISGNYKFNNAFMQADENTEGGTYMVQGQTDGKYSYIEFHDYKVNEYGHEEPKSYIIAYFSNSKVVKIKVATGKIASSSESFIYIDKADILSLKITSSDGPEYFETVITKSELGEAVIELNSTVRYVQEYYNYIFSNKYKPISIQQKINPLQ